MQVGERMSEAVDGKFDQEFAEWLAAHPEHSRMGAVYIERLKELCRVWYLYGARAGITIAAAEVLTTE
jgi:hypothetical protein